MKIVYICNEMNLFSGWGVLNYHTIQNALNFFEDVIVFTLKDAKNTNINRENLQIYPVLDSMNDTLIKSLKIMQDRRKIKNNIDIESVDIVHVLIEPLLPLITLFSNSYKVFNIVGTYSIKPFESGINQFLYKRSLKKVDVIVAISEYTKIKFNNKYNQNIIVIPLGVDNQNFYMQDDIKEKSFVFVGHIKPRKGLIYAIKALQNIILKDESVKLYIIGARSTGKYAEDCFKYIKDNKLEKNIIFLGKISHEKLVSIYNCSICNILPSVNIDESFEGFGLIHLEANACGIPSIGSLNCGNESAIIHEKTGLLCIQKNVEDIQKKMEILIKDFDNNQFDIWRERSLEYAQKNDWKNYFESLYKKTYNNLKK